VRRLALIVAVLIVISAVEITVVIAVSHAIGWGWTLLLLLATSALGGYLLRREGGRAWSTFRDDASSGRPPGNAATDGVLILAGGVFMLVPGFVSDAVGLLLLIPPTRHVARGGVQRLLANRISPAAASSLFGPRRVRARAGQATYGQSGSGGSTDRPGTTQTGQITRPQPDGRPGEPIEGEIIDPRDDH